MITQGDHVKITSRNDIEKRMEYITKRIHAWDYTVPCVVRVEAYVPVASTSQSSLFHVWCREIASKWMQPKPTPEDEATIKMMMKNKFLGSQSYTFKNTTLSGQVKSTRKLSVGEWCFFLDQVYDLATKGSVDLDGNPDLAGVMLTVPMDSDYSKLKRKQVE